MLNMDKTGSKQRRDWHTRGVEPSAVEDGLNVENGMYEWGERSGKKERKRNVFTRWLGDERIQAQIVDSFLMQGCVVSFEWIDEPGGVKVCCHRRH